MGGVGSELCAELNFQSSQVSAHEEEEGTYIGSRRSRLSSNFLFGGSLLCSGLVRGDDVS